MIYSKFLVESINDLKNNDKNISNDINNLILPMAKANLKVNVSYGKTILDSYELSSIVNDSDIQILISFFVKERTARIRINLIKPCITVRVTGIKEDILNEIYEKVANISFDGEKYPPIIINFDEKSLQKLASVIASKVDDIDNIIKDELYDWEYYEGDIGSKVRVGYDDNSAMKIKNYEGEWEIVIDNFGAEFDLEDSDLYVKPKK
ncbi:hypothetical protein F348_093 [Campylobacter phage F348]|uniref:Uncharacterized protein n=1 Tax=Campylobacter phage F348 TaxID=2794362 RepID=A0A7T3N450_9CAUD|nr:hypothetical protein F348_093 [Campylobacter phage F348]